MPQLPYINNPNLYVSERISDTDQINMNNQTTPEAGPSGISYTNIKSNNIPVISVANDQPGPSTSILKQRIDTIDIPQAVGSPNSGISDLNDIPWDDFLDGAIDLRPAVPETKNNFPETTGGVAKISQKRPSSSNSEKSAGPPAKASKHSQAHSSNCNALGPVIVLDQISQASVQKLINTLSEIFPDCQINFLEKLCREKEYSTANVDIITDQLLTQDYPKKEKEVSINFDEQLEIMMNVLPDADPEYLSNELTMMQNSEELKLFISEALEFRNYPKLEDVVRKKQISAQVKQYTTDFNPVDFLKLIPDPETYFDRKTFRAGVLDDDVQTRYAVHYFLRNHFSKLGLKMISSVMENSSTILEVVEKLDNCMKTSKGIIHSKRKRIETQNNNIPLLQLFAYITHKRLIERTKEQLKIDAEKRKQEAIDNKEVNTCGCCFDEEVMREDSFCCTNGCLFCKQCIRQSAEILFAENNLAFPCLLRCGADFTLEILQACLTPKIFCKIAKRKQLEEVKAAGIEDLEICPFCDFASIPSAADKVFKCLNPECMKETCRLCKEPSHIPLRCDEVEKDHDVKQRVFVENQMTEALMRKCWRCQLKFIKSDGCNKITCQCGATMCYICNQSKVEYNHFNGLGGKEFQKCPLYSNTDLLHEQNAINGGLQAKKQLGVDSLKVDPLADAEMRIDHAKKTYTKRPGEH
ncbi:E3 ubiquitin-protein ligase RNF216-like isoform X2 [Atheta coriaria]